MQRFYLCLLFLAVFWSFDVGAQALTCTSDTTGKTRDQLELILLQCEKEINDQKTALNSTKQQSSILEKAVADLNYKIKTSQLEINARNIKIKQIGENIVTKVKDIGTLSERLNDIKTAISKLIRESSLTQSYSLPEILLSNQNFSEFLLLFNQSSEINDKLHDLSLELQGVKVSTEKAKTDLETKQTLEEKMKYEQEAEKKKTEKYKQEQQNLLKFNKGQEALYAKQIAEREKIRNEIRNRMFRTVGGQEISFGNALKLIQPYESTIGVSSALILAVLFQESSVDSTIGKNIGKCTYNQPSSCVAGKTVMSDNQKPVFLDIMTNLGLNADKTPVSCAICRDGNYGGAMGPAQFMPVTWNGISSRVARILNISYPSPFESLHAFTAAAVLLKDNQTRCKTSFTKTWDLYACSAAKYYGGLSLSGTRLNSYMYNTYGYGHQVADRATQFQKDIDLLD